MKPQIENLKAQMQGFNLTIMQRADALIEFNKLIEYVDGMEQQVSPDGLANVGGSLPTKEEVRKEAEKLYKTMMNGTPEDIRQSKTAQLMFLSGAWFARGFKKH